MKPEDHPLRHRLSTRSQDLGPPPPPPRSDPSLPLPGLGRTWWWLRPELGPDGFYGSGG